MPASQTPNSGLAREILNIRLTAENAYREFLGINPILKRNSSAIESFEERLKDFTFLAGLEEKFKLLCTSLDSKISSFSSKLDAFFSELSFIKKILENESKNLDSLRKEFATLSEAFISFKKTIENCISDHGNLLAQKIDRAKNDEEKLRKELQTLFVVKENESKQQNQGMFFKIETADENFKSLLEEMRRLKISIRVLENNMATLRNKEKG